MGRLLSVVLVLGIASPAMRVRAQDEPRVIACLRGRMEEARLAGRPPTSAEMEAMLRVCRERAEPPEQRRARSVIVPL